MLQTSQSSLNLEDLENLTYGVLHQKITCTMKKASLSEEEKELVLKGFEVAKQHSDLICEDEEMPASGSALSSSSSDLGIIFDPLLSLTQSTGSVSDESNCERTSQSKDKGKHSKSKEKRGNTDQKPEIPNPSRNEPGSKPPILLRTYRPKISVSDVETVEAYPSEHRCPANLCMRR